MRDTSFITKLFSWSIIFESLLIFIFSVPGSEGNVVHLGRLLQLLVLFLLLANPGIKKIRLQTSQPLNSFIKFYSLYLVYTALISVIGILVGSYNSEYGSYSIYIRPAVEYAILIHYFIYFSILPTYFFRSMVDLNYFLDKFIVIFWLVILIGLIDLLFVTLGFEGLYRHFYDKRSIGFRFHSILGEPRDAFAYLLLVIPVIYFRDLINGITKSRKLVTILIITCLFLTQSFSGVLGVFFSITLITLYILSFGSNQKKIIFLTIISISTLVAYEITMSSSRLVLYYDKFLDVFIDLEDYSEVRSVYSVAINNIYPLWDLWLRVKEYNILPLFFGNGIGSASFINNQFMGEENVVNPNASLIRSIYETGLVGTFILLYFFLKPIKYISCVNRERMMIFSSLLIGSFFLHRSVTIFIFIGIVLVVNNLVTSRMYD